ncbi:hypothetical protein Tco_1215941 [Tanacetum coccineum]
MALDTQKDDDMYKVYSVSSKLHRQALNLKNPSPADNEIASLMETLARHAMAVPKYTSSFTITIPPPPPFFNPILQQATPTPTLTTSEATTSFPLLSDFSSVFRFNDRVTNLEKNLSEIKQLETALLFSLELTKIMIGTRWKEGTSHSDKAGLQKRKLYDALVESYNTDKDLFDSYGNVFSLKRSRDEKDKD